jgi:hypothetical protein
MNWTQFLDACREWQDGRQKAVDDAWSAVRRQAGNDNYVPAYVDLARQAAHSAGVQYELTVPRPEWQGEPGGGNNCRLQYVDEADVAAAAGAGCAA